MQESRDCEKKERKRKLSHFYPNILTFYQLIAIGNAQQHKPSQVNLHDFTLTHPNVKHLTLKFTKRWKRGFTHVHLHGGYVLSHTHTHTSNNRLFLFLTTTCLGLF